MSRAARLVLRPLLFFSFRFVRPAIEPLVHLLFLVKRQLLAAATRPNRILNVCSLSGIVVQANAAGVRGSSSVGGKEKA